MLLSDRVTGATVALLGAAAAWSGSQLPPVPGQQVGPSAFPTVVGAGLVICGALIAFGIGQSFEEGGPDEIVHERDPTPHPERSRLHALRPVVPPALLLFYALASETLGFVPTAAIMIFCLAVAFRGSLKLAIGFALIGPVFVHLIFYKLLRVPLPPGLLPMPW